MGYTLSKNMKEAKMEKTDKYEGKLFSLELDERKKITSKTQNMET